jgi:N4-gp56 family major capsid protein
MGNLYVCFLSPEQVRDLRKSDSTWFGVMKQTLAGGKVDENPIFTGSLGIWNGVLFMESELVPPGLNLAADKFKDKTRRAWIGGASALFMAHGRGFAPPGFKRNRFRWDRETEDFGHQQQIAATTITGIARPRYQKPGESSAREAGVFVIETYADHGLTGSDVYSRWIAAGGALEA